MDIFIKLSQFLLSLSLLIILHELGHFIPAKLFKTRVEKFYLFFDVKYSLLKKKIGDTEYGIGWLPLGGYVKISGMIDESMDKEQMALPPQPWEFRSKPAYQRLIIMLGGVTVNFILAFIIYIGMAFAYGDIYIANEDMKDGLLIENKAMQKAGFKTGDHIVSVDGEKIVKFDNDINMKVVMAKEVLIERNGTQQAIKMPIDFVDQLSKQEKEPLVSIRMPFVVGAVSDGSKNTALQPKDVVLALNGQPAKYFDQAKAILEKNKNKTIPATILRDQKEIQVPVIVSNDGKLGIGVGGLSMSNLEKLGYYKISKQEFSLLESIPVGITKGKDQLIGYGKQLKMIFSPSTGAYKQVGGFKAIFDIFPNTWSWETFWTITALLSIMLGVMNLLPIPALDGGHVMFLLYEIISGKKPSDKFLENAQMVGFVLLITLLLFANGNDIYKAIVGR
ncbi:MAG: RIP metalloprotease RseP [Flavobacterium sp.]|jgi:regulator of sigma E protease|uniref:RIP metalloprotease RseP n=1 Tax=Flavobacterium sp. TaxID=239 RepID=UPI001B535D14|nr:RIP metalloprotease RseP [Flavobacterium sp.]MBP6146074.1 RIP metalloprotease RseP [Flavobacterium sp.]MBP7183325.1 RIP metalloprotease RseP [Flavobacterium sp.]MBP7317134.1 RIP metalloprotease RseP [Flavobacterium sp.]MBP8887330.1 RIP metalloprotease RseP [Flavobacterium sp.]HRL71639.1 RIP metalloprotease RseP [Flavobacterium sp.]